MDTTLTEYNGYKVTTRKSGQVQVFDPRFPRQPAVYETTSLDLAWRWIDAYRAGAQWAVDAVVVR